MFHRLQIQCCHKVDNLFTQFYVEVWSLAVERRRVREKGKRDWDLGKNWGWRGEGEGEGGRGRRRRRGSKGKHIHCQGHAQCLRFRTLSAFDSFVWRKLQTLSIPTLPPPPRPFFPYTSIHILPSSPLPTHRLCLLPPPHSYAPSLALLSFVSGPQRECLPIALWRPLKNWKVHRSMQFLGSWIGHGPFHLCGQWGIRQLGH